MGLFKKDKKQKKKVIPKDKILKAIKGKDYVDLGDPFGESARKYLAYQLSKMIDNNEITGTVVTPEGVYLSLTSSEVKNIVKLIEAKGISNLSIIAQENNWNLDIVTLIAKNRINLYYRKDGKVITKKASLDLLQQELNQNSAVDLTKVAEEFHLSKTIIRELLDSLLQDKKLEGFLIKSRNEFLPIGLLEESIKEQIEDLEKKKLVEVKFSDIADEFGLLEEQIYPILLKLYNSGDIDIQLNLGQRLCILKTNVKKEIFEEKIPQEEKKLEIEDLSNK